MSQKLDEQLSAFIDGELPEAELDLLLARLDRDPARRHVLARYSMIGECIRTGAPQPAALALTERVRAALLAERQPATGPAPAWRGWVAGAMAAAAALTAVLVAAPSAQRGGVPVVGVEPAVPSLIDEPLMPVRSVVNYRLDPDAAARLTGYLVAHGEYASQLSRNNFDSHLVSAGAERASWRQAGDLTDVR